MNTEDKDFVARAREAYRADEMTARQIRRFDEALSERLARGRGRARTLTWAMAMAVVAVGIFAMSQMVIDEETELDRTSSEVATVTAPSDSVDEWPTEDDVSALTMDDVAGGDFDELLQDEWLPDDYQALAMVIDLNSELEILR